jgi:hypothetical protein
LDQALVGKWEKLDMNKINKPLLTMPERLEAVQKAHGGAIPYWRSGRGSGEDGGKGGQTTGKSLLGNRRLLFWQLEVVIDAIGGITKY